MSGKTESEARACLRFAIEDVFRDRLCEIKCAGWDHLADSIIDKITHPTWAWTLSHVVKEQRKKSVVAPPTLLEQDGG